MAVITETGTAIKTLFDDTPHNDFYNDLSGRLYYIEAPSDVTFPYSTYFFPSQVPNWSFGNDFESFLVQFDIFSKETPTSSLNNNIYMGHCCDLFDDASLTLTNYYHCWIFRNFVTPAIKINGIWQSTVQFRVELEKK